MLERDREKDRDTSEREGDSTTIEGLFNNVTSQGVFKVIVLLRDPRSYSELLSELPATPQSINLGKT
jgi:hypothetical protein